MIHDPQSVFNILSACRFDPWNPTGHACRSYRQSLLTALTGKKQPLTKCGVNALETALGEAFPEAQDYPVALKPRIVRGGLAKAIGEKRRSTNPSPTP